MFIEDFLDSSNITNFNSSETDDWSLLRQNFTSAADRDNNSTSSFDDLVKWFRETNFSAEIGGFWDYLYEHKITVITIVVVILFLVMIRRALCHCICCCCGFTSEGPRANSVASSCQSCYGSVPSGSLFSCIQSRAMR